MNGELNDVIGNFVHRTLTFIWRYFKGRVPEPGRLGERDEEALSALRRFFKEATEELEAFRLREALRAVVEVAREGNRYLNEREPWKAVKEQPELAKTTLYVCAQLVKALSIMLAPFVPSSAQALWDCLLYTSPSPRDRG